MTDLIVWKNREMDKLRRDMDRLFEQCWSDLGSRMLPLEFEAIPSVELSETEETLRAIADLPGIDPKRLNVSVSRDALMIRGERRQESVEEREGYHSVRHDFGSFSRTVRLPCKVDVERIKATYRKGRLEIVMPKLEVEKPRGIQIEVE